MARAHGAAAGLRGESADDLAILLKEYESVSNDIRTQIGFQTQTFNFAATGLAVLLGLLLGQKGQLGPTNVVLTLLAINVLSSVFGMFLVDKDLFVLTHVKYLEKVLRPALSEHAGSGVLEFHHFKRHWLYSDHKPLRHRVLLGMTGPFPHGFFLMASVSAAATLWFMRSHGESALPGRAWIAVLGVTAFCSAYLLIAMALAALEWRKLGACTEDPCETKAVAEADGTAVKP